MNGGYDLSRKNNRGFTLAELLIVVAIIAVLVAIAIPVFTSSLEKARAAVCAANRRSLLGEMRTAQMMDHALCEPAAAQNMFDRLKHDCPSKGALTASYDDAGFLLTVTCSVHGQSDFDKALAITSGIDKNLGDYGYIKDYVSKAEAAGGLITIDKDAFLSEYFKDGPSEIHHNINSDNPIVWCGMQIKYNGEWQQMLVATQKSNVVRELNPLLSGYVLYYNGSYYRSTKTMNSNKLDENTLRMPANNSYSYEQALLTNGWEKVS